MEGAIAEVMSSAMQDPRAVAELKTTVLELSKIAATAAAEVARAEQAVVDVSARELKERSMRVHAALLLRAK